MPSSRRLRLTPDAEADIAAIWQFTAETWSEEQAETYVDLIWAKLKNLCEFPSLGRPRDDLSPGLRSVPVEQHMIFYRMTDAAVIVRRIIHQNRDARSELGQ